MKNKSSKNKNGNATSTVVGILAGVAIGATLGILFAPDKGTSTRKKISKKSADTTDDLKSKFDGIVDSISQTYNSLLNKGEQLAEKSLKETSFENIKQINKFQ